MFIFDDPPKTAVRIVLTVPGDKEAAIRRNLSGVVRLDPEAEIAVRKLCDATGLTQRDVASQLLIQAAEVCEIVKGGERDG